MVTGLRNAAYKFGSASYPSRLTGTLGRTLWFRRTKSGGSYLFISVVLFS